MNVDSIVEYALNEQPMEKRNLKYYSKKLVSYALSGYIFGTMTKKRQEELCSEPHKATLLNAYSGNLISLLNVAVGGGLTFLDKHSGFNLHDFAEYSFLVMGTVPFLWNTFYRIPRAHKHKKPSCAIGLEPTVVMLTDLVFRKDGLLSKWSHGEYTECRGDCGSVMGLGIYVDYKLSQLHDRLCPDGCGLLTRAGIHLHSKFDRLYDKVFSRNQPKQQTI